MLPVDHVVASEFKAGRGARKSCTEIPAGKMALDIGPKTIEEYTKVIEEREDDHLERADGRVRDASVRSGHGGAGKAVAESGAVSVVGGGDSEKAIKSAGVTNKITHVSTGGGASLEFLSGIELPGVAALTDK